MFAAAEAALQRLKRQMGDAGWRTWGMGKVNKGS